MLLYSAIARGQTILVSYEVGNQNFEAVAESMLKNIPRMQDSKCTYTSDNYLFHVIIEDGLLYMCTADANFGRLAPFSFLQFIKEKIRQLNLISRCFTAGSHDLDREFAHILANEMDKASRGQGEGADQLTKMRAQVNEVTGIMTQNIEKVLERGDKLETLVDKAADLEANAVMFKGTSKKLHRKMKCKNIKCWIIVISILVIGITLTVLLATNTIPIKSKDSSKKQ